MKNAIKICNLFIALLCFGTGLFAQAPPPPAPKAPVAPVSKVHASTAQSRAQAIRAGMGQRQKKYSKTYTLRSNQGVNINNLHGDVVIHNWDRDEVKVDVNIEVVANSDRNAEEIINRIAIESNDGNPVSFHTKVRGGISTGKNNTIVQVHYTVFMPSNRPLSVKNNFGNTKIPDWQGQVNIDQMYGDIITGTLPKANNIKVSFGGLKSKTITDGNLKISYSNLTIDKLSGIVTGSIDFCDKSTIGLEADLKKLDMRVAYSDLILSVAAAIDASFNINTSYGELNNNSKIKIVSETKEKTHGPTFNKNYNGKSGSGKASITISSSFGNITLK